jgi:hypothetical protein
MLTISAGNVTVAQSRSVLLVRSLTVVRYCWPVSGRRDVIDFPHAEEELDRTVRACYFYAPSSYGQRHDSHDRAFPDPRHWIALDVTAVCITTTYLLDSSIWRVTVARQVWIGTSIRPRRPSRNPLAVCPTGLGGSPGLSREEFIPMHPHRCRCSRKEVKSPASEGTPYAFPLWSDSVQHTPQANMTN